MQIYIDDKNIGKGRAQEEKQRMITSRDDLYLATIEDAERFYKASHKIYTKEGYNVKANHCPMLISRSEEVKAEHIFIDESMYLVEETGLKREKLNSSLSGRREYVKLVLDLVLKIIEYELNNEIK